MDQYDEFGNFIGELSDSDEASETGQPLPESPPPPQQDEPLEPLAGMEVDEEEAADEQPQDPRNQIILHEDKRYYTPAEEVYGPEVSVMVQEEDTQPLEQPIVAPIKERKFNVTSKGDGDETSFDKSFLLDLTTHLPSVRNVAVVGQLHHGKTALVDMLVLETHKIDWDTERQLRYTDTPLVSQARGISLKSSPVSLVLQSTNGKSHLFNIIDTPGHVNFQDEAAAAARLADGVVVVVDAVEGVYSGVESIITYVLQQKLPLVLVINKVDRLILELRLPPTDAYYKLRHVIEEVNTVISRCDPDPNLRVSPERGNVAFASTSMGWCFTLGSFANMYSETFGRVDTEQFAMRMWGNIYFNPSTRKFGKKPGEGWKRSFEHFVLEPLWKIYSQVLGEEPDALKITLKSLGIHLKPFVYKMDTRPLLKAVLSEFFGPATGLVDMVSQHIPDPRQGNALKVHSTYTGPLDSPLAQGMLACDPDGPLVVHISKLYSSTDAQDFHAFGRVLSGTVRKGEDVRVLGEGFSIEDEEDMAMANISNVWIHESRYSIGTDGVPAGNLVLLGGVSNSIAKTATIVSNKPPADPYIFRPLNFPTQAILKIAVEPVQPSELPKMLDGLRKINKSYPLVETRVEESGEHVVLGTGELYLDCIMHDLRRMYAEIEIKVSDPVVRFCETVIETSGLKCYAETPNKKNKITMITEPLEKGIAEDIETENISLKMPMKQVSQHFQEKYSWDVLASRSIWAFGPTDKGPNILVDDTLPSDVDKTTLGSVKESIKQGFQWATREGPLCDEPIRNVKFRLLDASLASEPIFRGGGQIIPTARRVCYSSMLMATPRLMEPVYFVDVQCPADAVAAVYTVLARRRGHVTQDIPKPGSPLYQVKAYIPVVDAAGFETDLRTSTQGQAMCMQSFDHWSIVPGDPTEKSIVLRPLEPSPAPHLARDFTLKTRRRKGLADELSVAKYLDAEMIEALAATDRMDLIS